MAARDTNATETDQPTNATENTPPPAGDSEAAEMAAGEAAVSGQDGAFDPTGLAEVMPMGMSGDATTTIDTGDEDASSGDVRPSNNASE